MSATALAFALFTPGAHAADLAAPDPSAPAIEAVADKAVIVFFRPSKYGRSKPAVVDHNGAIVAQLVGKTHYVHLVDPGEHTFTTWGEGTPTLKATVEAGEIYYVKMDASMGAWTARFPMVAMGPDREGWHQMSEWLGRTKRWTLDEAEAKRYTDKRAEDVQVVIGKGKSAWASYDAQRKANRAITPDDGVTSPLQ